MMQFVSRAAHNSNFRRSFSLNAIVMNLLQGSPAGHRLFHTAILPYLARQLRSEELRETAEVIRKSMLEELEGRIVV
jgi:hypothetical protein